MREIFLKKEKLDRAINLFSSALKEKRVFENLKEEEIFTASSLGRITSRPVVAKISNPFFNASAVDGFALRSAETSYATINNPKLFKIGIDTVPVNTGDPILPPYDCVVMIEDVEIEGEYIKVFSPLHLYENIRVVGEDFAQGEIVIPVFEKITPAHIGVLIASNNERIFVFEKPKILVIATGEEVKRIGDKLKVGDVIDSNSFMIYSILEEYGADPVIYDEILPNNFDVLKEKIKEASPNYHMIVVIGGSAKGTKDLIAKVFESFSEVLFHGLTIQPGKPLVIGFNGKVPLIGLPGFPVSSYIDAKIFLKVALENFTGNSLCFPKEIIAKVKRDIPSSLGVEEFIRVKVEKIDNEVVCVPLKKGAANISSVARADGVIRIKEEEEGVEANSLVSVGLYKSVEDVFNQLLFIGSNDPLFEYLLNFIRRKDPFFKFGIVNVGSLGGLLAFERGETIITSVHLFDKETKLYNTPFLQKYLRSYHYVRFHLVNRNQGLIVQKGNPKEIRSLKDLERDDVKFVNRQKGSGTRVFFDYLAEENKLDKRKINGYEIEEITHLGVANAVKDGIADCGVGIEYVARVFDLDFIKLGEEEYELIIRKDYFEDLRIQTVINESKNFISQEFINDFKGYKFIGMFKEDPI
ncbi:MAG: molybdopterin biosynthesis protein [Nitrososphaeria archaeon]